MRLLRFGIVVFVIIDGGYMLLDGIHALVTGSYIGAGTGQLGPWASIVSAVGVKPASRAMELTFVALGLAWFVALALYLRRPAAGSTVLAIVAVATLWYAPFGTLFSVLTLAALFSERRRAPQEESARALSGRTSVGETKTR